MSMDLRVARHVYKSGGFKSATLVNSTLYNGWIAILTTVEGEEIALDTDRGQVRIFAKIDTAWGVLRKLGFRKVLIDDR